MRCKTCHYSLLSLKDHRCPECGRAFDPADASTWELQSLARRRRLSWTLLVILISLALFLIAATIPLLRNYSIT